MRVLVFVLVLISSIFSLELKGYEVGSSIESFIDGNTEYEKNIGAYSKRTTLGGIEGDIYAYEFKGKIVEIAFITTYNNDDIKYISKYDKDLIIRGVNKKFGIDLLSGAEVRGDSTVYTVYKGNSIIAVQVVYSSSEGYEVIVGIFDIPLLKLRKEEEEGDF